MILNMNTKINFWSLELGIGKTLFKCLKNRVSYKQIDTYYNWYWTWDGIVPKKVQNM